MKDTIEKIDKGTVFWEGRFGPFTCTKKPEFTKVNANRDDGYIWKASDKFGLEHEFLWVEKYSHYGPKIYLYQAYMNSDSF